MADRLSEVLDLIEVHGVLTGGFAVRGCWVSRAEQPVPLKFVAVVRGRAWLTTDADSDPVRLDPGDAAIVNDRSWLCLEGGAGEGPRNEIQPREDFTAVHPAGAHRDGEDVVVGGRIDVSSTGRTLLLDVLPPVTHVRAADGRATALRSSLDRLLDEMTGRQVGSSFATRQHGRLVVLEVLRAVNQLDELPPGSLRVIGDQRLRPAVDLMHDHPGRPWALEDLARAASMSRTTFAQRFRHQAGIAPMTYLTRWRMLLAQHALRRDDALVAALASQLGYASESSFSTAFTRVVGMSPRRYRDTERRGAVERGLDAAGRETAVMPR